MKEYIETNEIIKVVNLEKDYKIKGKEKALKKISFEITKESEEKGKIVALLGQNGSGKTTAINILLGLDLDYEGDVYLFGKNVKNLKKKEKKQILNNIGAVFQDVYVIEELTVKENLIFFASLNDVKDKEKIFKLADKYALLEHLDKKPFQLSGGMLRRLNILCGILHSPYIIFFDEPTVGLDPSSRKEMLKKIMEMKKEGKIIFYTTHYLDEIEEIADEIIILDKGSIIEKGTKKEILEKFGKKKSLNIYFEEKEELDRIYMALKGLNLDIKANNSYISIITYSNDIKTQKKVFEALEKENARILEIQYNSPKLNDIFIDIVNKEGEA